MNSINVNVNYGGKVGTPTCYIKDFQNSLNYPIRNVVLPVFVKAFDPYGPYGNYIKFFNNYTSVSTKSSITGNYIPSSNLKPSSRYRPKFIDA